MGAERVPDCVWRFFERPPPRWPLLLALGVGLAALVLVALPSEGPWRAAKLVLALALLLGVVLPTKLAHRIVPWFILGRFWSSPRSGAEPLVTYRRDGSFTWRARGDMEAVTQATRSPHRWWDLDRAPRVHAGVTLCVPDATPPRRLRRATARALRDARRALPGRGKVRATGSARDARGPMTLVHVRLEVVGIGATDSWAEAAARAFRERMEREVGA